MSGVDAAIWVIQFFVTIGLVLILAAAIATMVGAFLDCLDALASRIVRSCQNNGYTDSATFTVSTHSREAE